MIRILVASGRFKKDMKRAVKRGKDLAKLTHVLDLLLADQPLPPILRDHPLRGDWNGWRDLHIEPDWLLIYRVNEERVELAATGSHADLFEL